MGIFRRRGSRGRKADFGMPSAEGAPGYPQDMLVREGETARHEDPFTEAEFDSLAKIGDRLRELWPQVREDWEFMEPRVLEAKRSGVPLDSDLAETIARERLEDLGEHPVETRESDATLEALRANAQAAIDFKLLVDETVRQESTSGV